MSQMDSHNMHNNNKYLFDTGETELLKIETEPLQSEIDPRNH